MGKLSTATIATKNNRRYAPLAVAFLLLVACGQKGPLYLPGHSKDTPWPVPTNPPAPSAAPGPAAAAPSTAEGAASAPAPAPDGKTDATGVSAKGSASSSGTGAGEAPEKPGSASQAPQ